MAIITISRGSYSKGKAVAEGVAEKLGYPCTSRDILLEASERFNIEELKLIHAIDDAPSVLDRFTHGQTAYISYIQAALLEHVKQGNIVYHGHAGHFLLQGIDPVLKVRILADLNIRVEVMRERDGVGVGEARRMIAHIDEQRRKWTRRLYGRDPQDPSLYDLVICIDKIQVEGAIDLICSTAGQEAYRITDKHRRAMEDLALACKVKSDLLDMDHNVVVRCEFGNLVVHTRGDQRKARKIDEKVQEITRDMKGVHNIEVRAGVVHLPNDA